MIHKIKVSIIGCGRVGITSAYTTYLANKVSEIILFDRNKERIEAERLDFLHSLPFLGTTTVKIAQDLSDTKNSNIVVFTAGVSQGNQFQSRLALVDENTKILENFLPRIVEYSPNSVIIIVSNPVDVLTYKAYKIVKLPRGKIFSTGTTLDTSRFRFYLSEITKVNSKSIHAYILGEHGDSSFPTISSSNIGGQSLISFPGVTEDQIWECYKKAKNAAYEIIAGKGATYYAISVVINEIIEAIITDSKRVYPLSVPLEGEYDLSDVSLSVPCVIGKEGVEKIIEVDFSEKEKELLFNSAKVIKSYL